ncbi:MAG: ATP-binding protein [Dissulfurispiraceae bacterium]|jgi:AAA+ ATPase superfamily predicted ATPase
MRNPFNIGVAQERDDFCNRVTEKEDLLKYARNAQKVVVYSPRRYGKSSLMYQVQKHLAKEGFLNAYADFFSITSESEMIGKFATAVLRGAGKGVDQRSLFGKLKDVFTRFIPSIEMTPEGFNISAKFDKSANPDMLLADVLDGIQAFAKQKKEKVCIVLDEFQEIVNLPESKKIEGIIREHIQRQKDIAYFFVGSRRSILLDMFTDKSRPFYKSAFRYSLKEITIDEFVPFISQKFTGTGKKCAKEFAVTIYTLVRGYPYYVQKLAYQVWDLTEKECTNDIIQRAYNILVKTEAVDFEGIWSGLALGQRALLKAIAQQPTKSLYNKEYLDQHDLSVGGAQRATDALQSRDLIEKDEDGKIRLTDPIMAAWLVRGD